MGQTLTLGLSRGHLMSQLANAGSAQLRTAAPELASEGITGRSSGAASLQTGTDRRRCQV